MTKNSIEELIEELNKLDFYSEEEPDVSQEVSELDFSSSNFFFDNLQEEDDSELNSLIQTKTPEDFMNEESEFNFNFIFNRFLFYDIILGNSRKNTFSQRSGNLSNICDFAINELNLSAELYKYSPAGQNPLIKLSGKLTPSTQLAFFNFFQREFRNSLVGKTYYMQMPKLNLEGNEIHLNNLIRKRDYFIFNESGSKLGVSKKDFFDLSGLRLNTTQNRVYGLEELRDKSPFMYSKLIFKFNDLVSRGLVSYQKVTEDLRTSELLDRGYL